MKTFLALAALPASLRSIRHRASRAAAAAFGACLASAVLAGTLLTGASVRASLFAAAERRLGAVGYALESPEDFFTAALADRLQERRLFPVAPVLSLSGLAGKPEGPGPLRRVEVLGVDGRFFDLFGGQTALPGEGTAVVGERAAGALGFAAGDEIVLRLEKRSLLPLETVAGRTDERFVPLRRRVTAVVARGAGGAFSLRANQTAPLIVFLPLSELADAAGLPGLANVLLVRSPGGRPLEQKELDDGLAAAMSLDDYGLRLVPGGSDRGTALGDRRLFIRAAAVEAAFAIDPAARGRLTYFANRIAGAPYSFIAAADRADLPFDPGPDGMFVSDWLAADQGVRPGSAVEVAYYALDDRATLVEHTARFTVRGVLPQTHALFDARLTPEFPGLTDVPNCRDWRAGVPVDIARIRRRDEDFWNRHRAAPKAVIALERGRELWGTRFGDLTALVSRADASVLERGLEARLAPGSFGLSFTDARAGALAAAGNGVDFTGLFAGLGAFAVAASLLLLYFMFSRLIAERREEIGLFKALGWPGKKVFARLGLEGGLLALAGSLAGAVAGPALAACLVWLLTTLFRGAIGGAEIGYYLSFPHLLAGGLTAFVFSLAIVLRTLGREIRREAIGLLAGTGRPDRTHRSARRPAGVWPAGFVLTAAALVIVFVFQSHGIDPVPFFVSSVLLFAGLLCFVRGLFVRAGRRGPFGAPLARAAAALGRDGSRALFSVLILALGVYLIAAVGANTVSLPSDPARRDSGTGGFALVVETAVSVPDNLNDPGARRRLGLEGVGAEVVFVPMRVSAGDDASCLNLNRAERPEIVGVPPDAFDARGAFVFRDGPAPDGRSPWTVLDAEFPDGALPALADGASLEWGLGRAVGDALPVRDDAGRERRLRLSAALRDSLFQGSVVISEKRFLELFPSSRGYRRFLVDAAGLSPARRARLPADIEDALRGFGAEATPAADRLGAYQEVTNTYLLMFLVLGGFGLLIGLGGFGVFIRAHAARRAGEFALLCAVGYPRTAVFRQFLLEQLLILVAALATGLLAAALALLPSVLAAGGRLPWAALTGLVALMAGGGYFWTRRSARRALSGDLSGMLKKEDL